MAEYVLRLAVSCRNTHVVPGKSGLTQPSFFNSMLGAKERTAKNEKRVIRLFQSENYVRSGRPSSLNFQQIYESEVINNDSNVNPSLVAEVTCPEDTNLDRKIRLYVYYSSNLTSGKEILLAGTSFELRDLLSTTGVYSPKGEMFSEHCNNARANVLILNKINPVFINEDFSFVSSSKVKNPLEKEYVFYSSNHTTNSHGFPALHAQEITVEPRLSTQVSLEFLKSMKSEMKRSSMAWKERYLLERMRQGKFKTTSEAFANGWQEIIITVKGSNLDFSEDGRTFEAPERLTLFDSRDYNSRNTIVDSPVKLKMIKEQGSDLLNMAGNDRRVSTTMMLSGMIFGDVTSSYYNVSVQSQDQMFCRNVGNTNVEYMTKQPMYGSNVNAHVVSNAATEFEPSQTSWISHEDIQYDGTRSEIKGDMTIQSPITINGRYTNMHLYVPQATDCIVGLKLYVDMRGRAKSDFSNVGICSIPLVDYLTSNKWTRAYDQENSSVQICSQEFWAPVQIQDTRFGDGDARVLVSVSVRAPLQNECKYPAPYTLPDFCLQDLNNLESCRPLIENYEHRADITIASYPDGSEGIKIMNEIDSAEILAACYDWMHVCGCLYQDPLMIIPSDQEANIGVLPSATVRTKRLDAPYSVEWLESHIHNIDAIMMHLDDSINECEYRCKSNVTFRTSADKKKEHVQGCATNFHAQVLSCNAFRVDDISGDVLEEHHVLSLLTCGAPTTHALKTNRGGISNIERNINAKLREIHALKDKLYSSSNAVVSVDLLNAMDGLNLENCQQDMDNLKILRKVQQIAEDIEQDYLDVSLRRIYSLSQVLSIVINGLIMKLNMVVEGYIESKTASEWVEHGLLVIFEGLLSATGKERTMMEDAHAAIETLRLFKLKILVLEEKSQESSMDDTNIELEKTKENKVSVDVARRVAHVYIPSSTLSLLPPVYSTGCDLSICAILFTQGIDIKQSIATAYSGESAVRDMNSAEIQKYINIQSLKVLNEYCCRKHPIQQPTDSSPIASKGSHPSLGALARTIRNTSPLEKDVQMLVEIEQVGHLLDGLRVSFCKSGKDRTGMAVTLEQTRFIGNAYGCGTSDDILYKNASVMRLYGTRLKLCEKNIGKAVFSINSFQAQFLPHMYRPPPSVLESLLKTGKDTS